MFSSTRFSTTKISGGKFYLNFSSKMYHQFFEKFKFYFFFRTICELKYVLRYEIFTEKVTRDRSVPFLQGLQSIVHRERRSNRRSGIHHPRKKRVKIVAR